MSINLPIVRAVAIASCGPPWQRGVGCTEGGLTLRALLWDVDGTLAETERDGHRRAFNRAFADAGLPIHWDAHGYGRWLRISGGRERIAAQLQELEGTVADPARVEGLQRAKQHHYNALMTTGQLALRPGVEALLRQAHGAGLAQAIVTTSSRSAVNALNQHLLAAAAAVCLLGLRRGR